jgi:Arc/MetJ-type ribon-helix-helix transcriptional regulator
MEDANRVPISVSLPQAVVTWLDNQVETRRFASRSHAVEFSVLQFMNASAGSAAIAHGGFHVTREFKAVDQSEAEASDLKRQFVKAMDQAWNSHLGGHILKVALKGQKEPRLYYRLRELAKNVNANSTVQEYLAIDEELQVVKLSITATRGPDGTGASMEAEQQTLSPEQTQQFRITRQQMISEVERFLRSDAY